MTLGDEGMVFFPGLCTKADVNLLQQVGFCRLGGWKSRLEAFLQGVEDVAIGFNALSSCFSADLVFELGRKRLRVMVVMVILAAKSIHHFSDRAFTLSRTLSPGTSRFYCPRPGLQSTKPNASVLRKLAIEMRSAIGYSIFAAHAIRAALIRSGKRPKITSA